MAHSKTDSRRGAWANPGSPVRRLLARGGLRGTTSTEICSAHCRRVTCPSGSQISDHLHGGSLALALVPRGDSGAQMQCFLYALSGG